MTDSKKEKQSPSGYTHTKELVDKVGSTRLLQPLANMLNGLLDDPVLKQTLESAPVMESDKGQKKH